MTYFTMLTVEFAPAVTEKLPWKELREAILHYHHRILIGVVLAGVLLSPMHQSFLGGHQRYPPDLRSRSWLPTCACVR